MNLARSSEEFVSSSQELQTQISVISETKKAVVVARTVGGSVKEPSFVYDIVEFDLHEGSHLYNAVKADYNLVRNTLLDPKLGFEKLTGKIGYYIQPRTKGTGHGSTSRAFYARPLFLQQFIQLNP